MGERASFRHVVTQIDGGGTTSLGDVLIDNHGGAWRIVSEWSPDNGTVAQRRARLDLGGRIDDA